MPFKRKDDGFTLVEVLASLAVIGVVLTAVTTFFVRSMVEVDVQGARQTAIQVASSGMEQLRAVSAANVLTWLTSNAAPAPVKLNGLDYQRGWSSSISGLVVTATVTVTWSDKACPGGTCTYAAATLISTATREPVFDPAAS